jgi:hypothetical protein
MGDDKIKGLLEALRELAAGMIGSHERVSALTRTVEMQTSHLHAQAKKIKREKNTVA